MPTVAGKAQEGYHEKIPGGCGTSEPPLIIKLGLEEIIDINIPRQGGSKAHIQLPTGSSDAQGSQPL